MRRLVLALLALSSLAAAAGAPPAAGYPYPGRVAGDVTPVHDPSIVIRSVPPRYAVYSTGNQTRFSANRVDFTNATATIVPVPAWWGSLNPDNTMWAPDVSFRDGKYWMYYSVSSFGSNRSAIGLATSLTGEPGTWLDQGKVIESFASDDFNAIDPHLLVDAQGRWWVTFGSFWGGIHQFQVNPATGKATSTRPPVTQIASKVPATERVRGDKDNPIEAPFIFRRGSWYYLFVSFDLCCQGSASTYNVRVGRSSSPNGPFADDTGKAMLDGGGKLILATHDWVRGPGHVSVANDTADAKDLLVYHYYDSRAGGAPHLGINWLGWDASSWPYVW